MKDMIALFSGLRFRYLDLFEVNCVRLLPDACEGSLETLRLYPTDSYRKALSKSVEGSGLNTGNTQAGPWNFNSRSCNWFLE